MAGPVPVYRGLGTAENVSSMTTRFSQFDTHPRAVDKWLNNLPIASIGETARQLYMAMRDVNRQETVSVKHHFHLLEGICQPLTLILPELDRHYAGKPLPLSAKRRKVADLYTQLLRQIVLGYQQVIAHSIDLNRFGWKKVVTTSVHRIFSFSNLLLCNYRQLYMPYQKGMWQQLYWIYQLVEKYNLLGVKIPVQGNRRLKTSIACEFKKLLLHSLLSPNLFRQEELKEVIASLDLWVAHVSILTQHPKDNLQAYAFTLETDIPPGLIAQDRPEEESHEDVRYLDISDLLTNLNKIMQHAKPGEEQLKLSRGRSLSRRALVILLNSWGRPASRDSERRPIQGQTEVAIGISAIHYIMSNASTPATPPQAQTNDRTQVSAKPDSDESSMSIILPPVRHDERGQLSFTTDRETEPDVWDSAYFEPRPKPQSWTESMRLKVYSHLSAKVLNISKGGFCIAIPQDGVEHIQTNELVVVRGKDDQWHLGEIRWMICPTTGPIRAGVQKLSQIVKPAELHIRSEVKCQPVKCLLGRTENEYVLYLPQLPRSLNGNKLELQFGQERHAIRLGEPTSLSPIGSAHKIELIDRSALQANLAKSQDDYDSIWASL